MAATIALLAASAGLEAQRVDVRVDSRIELVSWAFRLAGRSEYNTTRVPRWRAAIDSQLAPLATHDAVAMSRRTGFGFFIPMNLAIHLTDVPDLRERSPFATSRSLHRRWTTYPESTMRYVALLREFAREVHVDEVMRSQRPLVDSARVRLERVATSVDQEWLRRFWAEESPTRFVLVAALTNGGASYGQSFTPDTGRAESYAIIGVRRVDAAGFPLFDASDMPTVLHEMNHPFVTPLVVAHTESIRVFGDSLFATVATKMREQAYGSWDAMINESIVRAVVIRYQLGHGDATAAERAIEEEIGLGFAWMRDLVQLLGEYEQDRSRYPTVREFMPRIVDLFARWPRRLPA